MPTSIINLFWFTVEHPTIMVGWVLIFLLILWGILEVINAVVREFRSPKQ